MAEATINDGVIECGTWSMKGNALLYVGKNIYPSDADLDDLYQVLHTWHMTKAVDKTYIDRVEKAVQSLKDDPLYKPEGGEEC